MSDVPHSEKFKKLLEKKFMSLGVPHSVAENLALKIEPVRKKGSLIFAVCSDSFHRNNVVNRMMTEISEVAKECWGQETEFFIEQETAPAALKGPTSAVAKKRRTSTFSKTDENLFLWETEQEEKETKDSAVGSHFPTEQTPQEKMSEQPKRSSMIAERSAQLLDSQISEAHVPDPTAIELNARSGATAQSRTNTNLQPDFIFETFVRGQSNMVAYSACEAVAKNPGLLSNPVFVYGSTGLGKTHLLHSVGNEIFSNHPSWKVVYVSSQDFMNELITSIRFNKTAEFRSKYHSADVLLVDDIQFLENKDSTQMEFFHIFNVLCEKKKQIVITSDKYPKDIPNIEVRLKSRFLQGLIADIEPPNFEDRVAIIEAKAKMMNLDLSKEIVMHIASHVRSNVREIQGLLTNLLMGQSMTGRAPTIDSTNQVLRRIINMQGPSIDISTIQKVVAQHFGLKVSDLTSPKREKRLVLPRHIAMYLSKEIMNLALTEIAENFHRGDHTTIQHAIKKVTTLISSDESTRASVKELRRKLEQTF